jgi:hypothetical protein
MGFVEGQALRKLIGFDDDTLRQADQLGRDRMATLQERANGAFAELLKSTACRSI